MLWFKFILGLMFFELVSILFVIVPDYTNEYMTKENKNWSSLQDFAPKLNLNHNIIYTDIYRQINTCRTAFRVLNSELEHSRLVDVKQINNIFDFFILLLFSFVQHNLCVALAR